MCKHDKNSEQPTFFVFNSAYQISGYRLVIDHDHLHTVADISFIVT
jgi:hypothetical protein